MNSNNKMSETIKNILEVTDSVLGRPATRGQVIQVLELIESFDTPEPATATATTKIKIAKAKATVGKVSTTRTKSTTKPRSKRHLIDWSDKASWFDILLNGEETTLTYKELAIVVPDYHKIRRPSLRNRFREEAIVRGFKSSSMVFNDIKGIVTIRAIN